MLIERVEVRLLELPLVEPFAAAHGTTRSREIAVVRVDSDHGHGWGECSALPEPTYTDELAAGAFVFLHEELAPRLVGHQLTAASIGDQLSVVEGHPMARAALEMAVLDIELRAEQTSLARFLGAGVDDLPAGAAVGLGPIGEVAERAAALAEDGFGRLKVKIAPGHDVEVVEAVLGRVAGTEVQVDGNGAYDARHLDRLTDLAASGIGAIEQPFSPADVEPAARLVERCSIPVVADEAAVSAAAVAHLRSRSALSGVSIKAARLGGILAARDLHDRCVEWGLAVTAGGMVESGLGRHALAALAALPGFTIAGDVSPAGRWLAADPWPDLAMDGGRITVPTAAGVAPDPDPAVLDHHTTERTEILP